MSVLRTIHQDLDEDGGVLHALLGLVSLCRSFSHAVHEPAAREAPLDPQMELLLLGAVAVQRRLSHALELARAESPVVHAPKPAATPAISELLR